MRFGVKVVDTTHVENMIRFERYDNFISNLDGLELSIKNFTFDLPKNYNYWIQHSNQTYFNIRTFKFDFENFEKYEKTLIKEMNEYNIKNTVVHLTNDEGIEDFNDEEIFNYLDHLNNFAKKNGFRVYLENTHMIIDEMKSIFNTIRNHHFGFCFDIGHAKAFVKKDSILDWLNFIDKLNLPIHVHFHSNLGEEDSHLPITKTTNNWIDNFHCNLTYYEIAQKLVEIKKNDMESSFIMETHAQFSKNNVYWLKKLIDYKKEIY